MPTVVGKRLVLVEWLDANTGSEDAVDEDTVDSYHKPTSVHTLGWVLRDNEKGMTLVTEYYDSTYRGRTFIPRICIKAVTEYKLTKPRVSKAASSTEHTHTPQTPIPEQ